MTRSGSGVAGLAALRTAGQVLACAGMAAALLVAFISACGWAAPFSEAPPTMGLARPTAHTLRAGDLQIGMATVLSPLNLHLDYGVTDNVQVGVLPLILVMGFPNIGAKFGFSLDDRVSVAIPVALMYPIRGGGLITALGAVASATLEGFALHSGGTVALLGGGGLHFNVYGILDVDVAQDVKLVGELDLAPFSASVGVLARFLGSLDVRAGVDLVPLRFRIGVDWTVNLTGDR